MVPKATKNINSKAGVLGNLLYDNMKMGKNPEKRAAYRR
jgi:hypothetical protein